MADNTSAHAIEHLDETNIDRTFDDARRVQQRRQIFRNKIACQLIEASACSRSRKC